MNEPCLPSYGKILIAFSGGKDSLACALHVCERLLLLGLDPRNIVELWHHDIDGREGDNTFRMDWPCTPAYVRAVGAALHLPVRFSWKVGGFAGELERDGRATAPIRFEDRQGRVREVGGAGPLGTRKRFPQVSADLSVRWCSAYLKIDVCAAAIRNDPRFGAGARTLVVSGERAEESSARAKYRTFEPDRSHRWGDRVRRHVDRWRPVHAWSEAKVWGIIERWKINPHPAYRLSWGRVSCALCIFGSPDQWASARAVLPERFAAVATREAATGATIQRKRSVVALADAGRVYPASMDAATVAEGLDERWSGPVFVDPWRMPAGAFGDAAGPT